MPSSLLYCVIFSSNFNFFLIRKFNKYRQQSENYRAEIKKLNVNTKKKVTANDFRYNIIRVTKPKHISKINQIPIWQ